MVGLGKPFFSSLKAPGRKLLAVLSALQYFASRRSFASAVLVALDAACRSGTTRINGIPRPTGRQPPAAMASAAGSRYGILTKVEIHFFRQRFRLTSSSDLMPTLTHLPLTSSPPFPHHQNRDSGDDEQTLRQQLNQLGLRPEAMAADGNCFFRALSDQRWGSDAHHVALRRDVVAYMIANRIDFEPFIEDDEKFDTYVTRMATDGVWAGNLELQAASKVCFANLCVHQPNQPRWEIVTYPRAQQRYFHVTYTDGEHYNSVRLVATNDGYEKDSMRLEEPGGPISLQKLERGLGGFRPTLWKEPSAGAVAETVASSGGEGKKKRARELLRLFDGCVESAAAALKAEVSYKGVLRGGGKDDPCPGETDGGDDDDGKKDDGKDDENADNQSSEDDWEPVVHRKGNRGGGGSGGGARVRGRWDDDLDTRIAALKI